MKHYRFDVYNGNPDAHAASILFGKSPTKVERIAMVDQAPHCAPWDSRCLYIKAPKLPSIRVRFITMRVLSNDMGTGSSELGHAHERPVSSAFEPDGIPTSVWLN